jgi:hypothetical protein
MAKHQFQTEVGQLLHLMTLFVEDNDSSTVHGELHKRYGNLYRN